MRTRRVETPKCYLQPWEYIRKHPERSDRAHIVPVFVGLCEITHLLLNLSSFSLN